jgi:hypothetical protein
MLAFIHIEKCGGTTLDNVLKQSFGIRHLNIIPEDKSKMTLSSEDIAKLKKFRPEILSISGHAVRPWVLRESAGSFCMYTLLRDPIERYISDFKHFAPCYQAAGDFHKWLKLTSRHNFITRSLCGQEDFEEAKRVLTEELALIGVVDRFDEFLAQLAALAFPLHLITDYQVKNKSENRYSGGRRLYAYLIRKMNLAKGVDVQAHADGIDFSSCMEEIRVVNRLDIQLYDYVVSEILPAQRQKMSRCVNSLNQKHASSLKTAWNEKTNFLYRNLIYKPMQGCRPFWPHALPEYRSVFR